MSHQQFRAFSLWRIVMYHKFEDFSAPMCANWIKLSGHYKKSRRTKIIILLRLKQSSVFSKDRKGSRYAFAMMFWPGRDAMRDLVFARLQKNGSAEHALTKYHIWSFFKMLSQRLVPTLSLLWNLLLPASNGLASLTDAMEKISKRCCTLTLTILQHTGSCTR